MTVPDESDDEFAYEEVRSEFVFGGKTVRDIERKKKQATGV